MIVSLLEKLVILDNGAECPITNMMDDFGDDTDDPRFAYTVVAGPIPNDGRWIAVEVSAESRALLDRLN
jgi:hypothetical protein